MVEEEEEEEEEKGLDLMTWQPTGQKALKGGPKLMSLSY